MSVPPLRVLPARLPTTGVWVPAAAEADERAGHRLAGLCLPARAAGRGVRPHLAVADQAQR